MARLDRDGGPDTTPLFSSSELRSLKPQSPSTPYSCNQLVLSSSPPSTWNTQLTASTMSGCRSCSRCPTPSATASSPSTSQQSTPKPSGLSSTAMSVGPQPESTSSTTTSSDSRRSATLSLSSISRKPSALTSSTESRTSCSSTRHTSSTPTQPAPTKTSASPDLNYVIIKTSLLLPLPSKTPTAACNLSI